MSPELRDTVHAGPSLLSQKRLGADSLQSHQHGLCACFSFEWYCDLFRYQMRFSWCFVGLAIICTSSSQKPINWQCLTCFVMMFSFVCPLHSLFRLTTTCRGVFFWNTMQQIQQHSICWVKHTCLAHVSHTWQEHAIPLRLSWQKMSFLGAQFSFYKDINQI